MNKIVTSREEILNISLEIGKASGLKNINIREIAQAAGVSVGSIYNYFPSKDILMVAIIESIWKDIMKSSEIHNKELGFSDNISALYNAIQKGSLKYPDFFNIHSNTFVNLNKSSGRESMNKFIKYVKLGLLESLENDPNVKDEIFNEDFSKMDFIEFVFSNMVTYLSRENHSCKYLIKIIEKVIY